MSRRAITFTVTLPLPVLADAVTAVRRVVGYTGQTLLLWQRRAEQRRQLEEMPERLRRDIGLTAEQVRDQARKPFWMS